MLVEKNSITERKVIDGLRPVDWSDVTRQNEFVNTVISALGGLGEKFTYDYISVLSGSSFRTFYDKTGQYNHGNYNIAFALWTVKNTFDLLGYDADVYQRSDFNTDKNLIVNSIDKGIPAIILRGIIDTSDSVVISGYDKYGEVLLGSSAFMCCCDDFTLDESGYFYKNDWHDQFFFAKSGSIVIINGKKDKSLSKEDTLKEVMKTAVKLIEGKGENAYMGLSAHTAYASSLINLEPDETGNAYFNMLCNNKMYLDKKFAADFFRENGENELAEIYEKIGKCVSDYGEIIPHDFQHEKLLENKDTVMEFCHKILQIRDLEAEALEIMKKKLSL